MGMYVDKGIDMCVNMSKAQEGVHQPEHPEEEDAAGAMLIT